MNASHKINRRQNRLHRLVRKLKEHGLSPGQRARLQELQK